MDGGGSPKGWPFSTSLPIYACPHPPSADHSVTERVVPPQQAPVVGESCYSRERFSCPVLPRVSPLPASPGLLTPGPVSSTTSRLSSVPLCRCFPVSVSPWFLCIHWSATLMQLAEHHAVSLLLYSRLRGTHGFPANT